MSMPDPIICLLSFCWNWAHSLLYRYLLIMFTAKWTKFLEYKGQLSWSQAERRLLVKGFEHGVMLGMDQSFRTLQPDSTSRKGLLEKCIHRTPVMYCILPQYTLEWHKPLKKGGSQKSEQFKMLTLKSSTEVIRRTRQFGQNAKVKGQPITEKNPEHVKWLNAFI
jgi:hypothetical protein